MNTSPPTYAICDLFTSVQGEGGMVGRPFVFLRFWGCPLSCPWCDEPRHRDPAFRRMIALDPLLDAVERQTPGLKQLLLTGGEPLAVRHLDRFVSRLKERGWWVAMETSGIGGAVPDALDWITLSPKTPLPHFPVERASEIKFILGAEPDPAQETLIQWWRERHPALWLQPRWDGPSFPTLAAQRCLEKVLASNGRLRLSLQIHKWMGIP
ncbi:MAG: 7-carboxy-7-deazaguanine synthase QueE [Magnetococcales bacterium]|nr:7-carboxy-7-deazaguanine synthase QueE [Magnetococcales bacterium]MBF0150957.1 7-carboxy-7-deazaguanine synthase QueE [Magnetococcales bacterium]